jgi:hypothetical protein
MGFIRVQTKVKNGKEYQYYYYSERRRSKVKDGGDGNVRSIDKLIGRDPIYGRYLSFWFWDGLSPVDYIEAFITWRLKESRKCLPGLRWWIDWKIRKGKVVSGKLRFRVKNTGNEIRYDARCGHVKDTRVWLQSFIDWILEEEELQSVMDNRIQEAAYNLACYEKYKKSLAESEEKHKQWRENPDRRWERDGMVYGYSEDFEDIVLEWIEMYRNLIDSEIRYYQGAIEGLMNRCPPSEKERFKRAITQQTERLAASPNFIDRYQCRQ